MSANPGYFYSHFVIDVKHWRSLCAGTASSARSSKASAYTHQVALSKRSCWLKFSLVLHRDNYSSYRLMLNWSNFRNTTQIILSCIPFDLFRILKAIPASSKARLKWSGGSGSHFSTTTSFALNHLLSVINNLFRYLKWVLWIFAKAWTHS